MADRTLVLAIFDNEAAADSAAGALKDSGLTSTDAMGVLAVAATGKLKEEKVGARSTGKGAGIGAALFLLGPAAIGVGVLGGAAAGALHHKGLGLSDADRERLRGSGESAGLPTGPAGVWTYAHRHGLRIGAVALAALIFVFQGQPSGLEVILITVLLLLVLGLIELIGRPTARPE